MARSATLAEPIMHETFVDLDDLVDKMNRYSTQGARQLQREGKSASLVEAIARAWWAFSAPTCCVPDFWTAARASCWPGPRRKARITATRSSCGCSASEPEVAGDRADAGGYSGHCHALVTSLVRATAGSPIELWSGEGSGAMAFGHEVDDSSDSSDVDTGCRRCCVFSVACSGNRVASSSPRHARAISRSSFS